MAEARRRADALGAPGARMLRNGVVGVPGDVARVIGEMATAGADTLYFHIYDPADPDHIRLLATEVLTRLP